jgi:hypothetical protein
MKHMIPCFVEAGRTLIAKWSAIADSPQTTNVHLDMTKVSSISSFTFINFFFKAHFGCDRNGWFWIQFQFSDE